MQGSTVDVYARVLTEAREDLQVEPVSTLRVPNRADIDFNALRAERLEKLQSKMRERGVPACLFFHPANIRYATGTTVMDIWASETFARHCVVPASGDPVLFECHTSIGISGKLVRDVRPAVTWQFMPERAAGVTRAWVADLQQLLRELGADGGPLGLDRLDTFGFAALRDAGIDLIDTSGITMAARDVKTPWEIELLKINGAIGDAILRDFEDAIRPGVREYELLATMTGSLLRHQGDRVFTRLISSGRNTNPWGSEAQDKMVMPGDLVCVDTDSYGFEGYMIDVSRTFFCGDRPSAGQIELYRVAHEAIVAMRETLRPGMSYDEFANACPELPARFQPQQYECMVHGVGLEDESPTIYHPGQAPNPADVLIEPGMALCFECYVGEVGGMYGVKLEDQVLVTEHGAELLCTYPYDRALLGM
jgi:Xaa-Pro aminopeptidase